MRRKSVLALTSSALVGLVWLAGLPAGAQHQHPQPLKPGKYRLQHWVEGADHFVHFEALATTAPSAHKTATGVAVPAGEAGEVKCRLEPLGARVQETTLHLLNEEGAQRLTKASAERTSLTSSQQTV